jgi:hypothetical protein
MHAFRPALFLALGLLSTPVLAQDDYVTGTWRSDNDKITFRAEYCGEGVQLCATILSMEDNYVPILTPFVGQRIEVRSRQMADDQFKVTPLVGMGVVSAMVNVLEPGHINVEGCLAGECQVLAFSRMSD